MPSLYQNGICQSSSIYTNMAVSSVNQTGNARRMKNVRSNNIEKLRIMRGMTREELAAKLKILPAQPFIGKKEEIDNCA